MPFGGKISSTEVIMRYGSLACRGDADVCNNCFIMSILLEIS